MRPLPPHTKKKAQKQWCVWPDQKTGQKIDVNIDYVFFGNQVFEEEVLITKEFKKKYPQK